MNNAIVQFNIEPDLYTSIIKTTKIRKTQQFIFDYSKKSLNLYCDKYNIDHVIVTEPKINYEHPTWERIDLWFDETWFEKYDNICYVDTDVFALPWADNIFQRLEDNDCFYRIPYSKPLNTLQKNELFQSIDIDTINKFLFQAGVILLNKNVINATMPIVKRYKESIFTDDSVLLNYAVMLSGIKVKNINRSFNVKMLPEHLQSKKTLGPEFSQRLLNVNFLHAFGNFKNKESQKIMDFLEELYE